MRTSAPAPEAPAPARHHRYRRARRAPPGSPPGTLLAPTETTPSHVDMIAYGPDALVERAVDPAAPDAFAAEAPVTWIDVQGIGDLKAIRALGDRFGLHPLVLEDIAHLNQRPKLEVHPDHLFIVVRMPARGERLAIEQLSLILGEGFVLTFQEHPGDCFDPVRARLRQAHARIRGSGADYLAYALIDALVDSYFPVLERCGEDLERLEQDIVQAPDAGHIGRVHGLKRELLEMRRALWPMREVTGGLMREETPFVQPGTRVFLRDCADHVSQLMDMVEIDREVASGLADLHLSSLSMRMNDVMKVLTVIATIFIPLSFIAGVYGMNFERAASPWNMPELGWYFGYPFALGVMAAVALGLLGWFRKKRWIGRARRE